jgi:hypothetical protein
MKTRRLVLALALGFLLLLGLAAAVLWVMVPRLIEREVVGRARDQGIELELGALDFGWEWARITQSKARLIDVEGLTLRIDTLDVELDGFELKGLAFNGLGVEADGALPKLALELGAWTKRFPNAYALPVSARGVKLEWRPEPGRPWLELTGGSIASTSAGTVVSAEGTRVAGADVGRVGATWTKTASSVVLGLGETDVTKSPLRVDVDFASPRPKVVLKLASTPLERLADPFAVKLPVQGVSATADVTLEFASSEAEMPERGVARGELRGWIPPHPAELDGFVFGDTTVLETKLEFAPDGSHVKLDQTRLTAGKFVLNGGGTLAREADQARLTLDLRGSLPCDALAGVAAESRLGRLLGQPAGKTAGSVARQVVGGSVSIRVQVDGSTRDLDAAKVTRSIGIGCGLKPLTLEDLRRLGETLRLDELSKLPEELNRMFPGALPSGLPPAPSGFPAIPSGFPGIPSGFPKLPPFPSAFPRK